MVKYLNKKIKSYSLNFFLMDQPGTESFSFAQVSLVAGKHPQA